MKKKVVRVSYSDGENDGIHRMDESIWSGMHAAHEDTIDLSMYIIHSEYACGQSEVRDGIRHISLADAFDVLQMPPLLQVSLRRLRSCIRSRKGDCMKRRTALSVSRNW